MSQSSQSAAASKAGSKPRKPYKDFPLFPHATKRWAKKIRGRLHYFGPWDDPSGALQKYLDQKDDLHAGRTPRTKGDELTLRELVKRFLTFKQRLLDSGDIVERTFRDYHDVCSRTMSFFGPTRLIDDLSAEDFERFRADISRTRGPVALSNDISRVRILFKWGDDAGLLEKPVRYGQGFDKPTKTVLRKTRADRGPRMFTAEQIQAMLTSGSIPLKAMILLGINGGMGNGDCAAMPQSALDLEQGWLDYPRPKTGIERRVPLWPETIEALRLALAQRPKPTDEADDRLVFITSKGKSWAKDRADNPISKETAKLLKSLGIHQLGLGFYCLRRTFETIAGGSLDQIAVDHIMGHSPHANDMAALYRQEINDGRLNAVVEHVHVWLYADVDRNEWNGLRVVG